MNLNLKLLSSLSLASLLAVASFAGGPEKLTWRYYRPGNTGIQGDTNECIWIDSDNDPWIGGYSPTAEEGGIAKLIQSENRWINVSNIDYPEIGTANEVGYCRVRDMVKDNQGNLWMATWRGALRMSLSLGPRTLKRFGADNSPMPGGVVTDMALAPDGTLWFSSYSTAWGGGGLTKYNPSTNTWTNFAGRGGDKIATQPKPTGGYYVWASQPGLSPMDRYDSSSNSWTSFPPVPGNPSHLISLDSTDGSGNVWMQRWIGNQNEETLDCIRPNGTWINPPVPPMHPTVGIAGLRAYGTNRALVVNGFGDLYQFNGTSWLFLGFPPVSGFINDLDIDSIGNIWICASGTGGALKRNASNGAWTRFRITNTSQYDLFNNDISIDPVNGDVYACANAGPGYGGMVKFDGVRWTGFNKFTYGAGIDWPFETDNSDAVYVRPSNRQVAVNPTSHYSAVWDGANFLTLPGGPDQIETYEEDSLGRLWSTGHYGSLGRFENGTYTFVSQGDWFSTVKKDPSRSGTVWANLGWELVRTDGNYRFSKIPSDFGSTGVFTGLAVQNDGTVWAGLWNQFVSTGSVLAKINPNTGAVQTWKFDLGWPFPGEHLRPLTVTPDGKVWMIYDAEYPSTDMGLLYFDGIHIKTFPAPPNGEWRWGGLPHAGITDCEVKIIPGGYELWLSCMTRGIAVLKVQKPILGNRVP